MIKRIVTIIVVNIKFSVLVTHEESTSLLIEVRLGISIVKDIPKHPDVCRDWRQLYWPCSGVGYRGVGGNPGGDDGSLDGVADIAFTVAAMSYIVDLAGTVSYIVGLAGTVSYIVDLLLAALEDILLALACDDGLSRCGRGRNGGDVVP